MARVNSKGGRPPQVNSNERELTPKQKRFVEEYLIDLNATQASIRAGYSKKYADRQAHELLEKTRVVAAIRAKIEERSKRIEITQDMVLKELFSTLTGTMGDVAEWTANAVTLIPKNELSEKGIKIIKKVKSYTRTGEFGIDTQVEVEIQDKLKAIELCMRHLGMLNDKLSLNTKDVEWERLQEIFKNPIDTTNYQGWGKPDKPTVKKNEKSG